MLGRIDLVGPIGKDKGDSATAVAAMTAVAAAFLYEVSTSLVKFSCTKIG